MYWTCHLLEYETSVCVPKAFGKALFHTKDRGPILNSSISHGYHRLCSVPCAFSWYECVWPQFFWWIWGAFALEDVEQLHGSTLVGDHAPCEVCVLGEVTVAAAAVSQFTHTLSHLVVFVEAHGHGILQSQGCGSFMVIGVEAPDSLDIHNSLRSTKK